MTQKVNLKNLRSWLGWFYIINVIVLALVGVNYLSTLSGSGNQLPSAGGHAMLVAFAILAYIGQFTLILFPAALLSYLVYLVSRRRATTILAAIVTFSITFLLVIADSIVFHHYQFHLGSVLWGVIRSGEVSGVLEFSHAEYGLIAGIAVGILLLESMFAMLLWKRLSRKQYVRRSHYAILLMMACLFISYGLFLTAQVTKNHKIIRIANSLPWYRGVLNQVFPKKDVLADLSSLVRDAKLRHSARHSLLNYPQHPLICHVQQHRLNVVVIAIDTWRADAMNAKVTPHIAAFAKHAIVFKHHYSGGNSTEPGIFSLFYGIPVNYWNAMSQHHHGPVLINQLLQEHYQLGIFASASLDFPNFTKNVFAEVPNLQIQTPGDTPTQRDKNITKEFKQFVTTRNTKKPFFSFLFYDGAHDWCGSQQNYAKPFQPAIQTCDRLLLTDHTNPMPYVNRYKNSVHFVDGLVGKDLQVLRKRGLLKNTVVIITADHGEEFNDEGLGYWGHASAYDPYQITTPFIVYWPGKQHRIVTYRTSHYDVVPTLMHDVLGCVNPSSDYSVGHSLFSPSKQKFLIVGSYKNYAIVQPNQITVIYPGHNYAIRKPNGHAKPNGHLNMSILNQVYRKLHAFYVKD